MKSTNPEPLIPCLERTSTGFRTIQSVFHAQEEPLMGIETCQGVPQHLNVQNDPELSKTLHKNVESPLKILKTLITFPC